MRLPYYENFNKYNSSNYIRKACKKYGIKNYIIKANGSIDVNDNNTSIHMHFTGTKEGGLERLPLNFNRVRHLNCAHNRLNSLEGAPIYIEGSFNLSSNKLTSLDGCPEYVGGYFNCGFNNLTSLKGGPKIVMGSYNCRYNKIRDFEGFPENFEGMADFTGNPVNEILWSIPDPKKGQFINLLNEYDVIRNGETIIKDRLAAAYEGIGLELPENIEIKGYEIV